MISSFNKSCDLYKVVDANDKVLGVGIELALPGFNKEQIELTATIDSVTIQSDGMENKSEYKYINRYGRIDRSGFSVSFDVDKDTYDTSKLTASFVNGILAIRIPVLSKPKAKSIKIN